MKIVRNEVGKYPEYAQVETHDIIGLDGDQYVALQLAIHESMEKYKAKGWYKDPEMKGRYEALVKLFEALSDHRSHETTFRKVRK